MRLTVVAVALVSMVVAPATGAAGARLRVTLKAPSHHPRAGTKWHYSVRATRGGKPIAARITVQVVDPTGTAHAVEYDGTKRKIVNRRFVGVFRDYVTWPATSRGFPLRLRVTVRAGSAVRTLSYRVVAR
jgi:hypothetical protein